MSFQAANERLLFLGGAALIGSAALWILAQGGLMALVSAGVAISVVAAFFKGLLGNDG